MRYTPIPQDWIKAQVDALLSAAERMPPGAFRDAILLRAEIMMDLVEAWRKS